MAFSLSSYLKAARVRWRAFIIWQKLGYLPWHVPREKKPRKNRGDFYKGAFSSIPFLNDDAKRTFSHLLLRPGYMMRDYIRGEHERYLAPFTALIIFYAFFALISAVLQPVQHQNRTGEIIEDLRNSNLAMDEIQDSMKEDADTTHQMNERRTKVVRNTLDLVRIGYVYLHLDQFPDEVDTQHESSIAALENTLRNQGIPLFLGKFFLLWLATGIALRKYRLGMSACAAVSAYVLCQFSFFMLFAVLLTWGQSTSVNVLLMLALLTYDLMQLLGISLKKSLRRAIAIGIHYGLLYSAFIILVSMVVVGIAVIKA